MDKWGGKRKPVCKTCNKPLIVRHCGCTRYSASLSISFASYASASLIYSFFSLFFIQSFSFKNIQFFPVPQPPYIRLPPVRLVKQHDTTPLHFHILSTRHLNKRFNLKFLSHSYLCLVYFYNLPFPLSQSEGSP
jgi:hypothetical protein